jgi:hypothetical protein
MLIDVNASFFPVKSSFSLVNLLKAQHKNSRCSRQVVPALVDQQKLQEMQQQATNTIGFEWDVHGDFMGF